jgi:hypothetical protein
MADDNTVRAYRSNEPYRRPAAPAPAPTSGDAGGSDPLAELARLIGQADPFAELRGRAQAPSARDAQAAPRDWPPTTAVADDNYPAADRYAAPTSRYQTHEPSHSPSPGGYAQQAEPAETRFAHQPADDHYDDGQYGHPAQQQPAYDDGYGEPPRDGYQSDADSDYPLAPQAAVPDDEIYDDAPRARRRSGLATAIVLVCCATVGSAAAYGYRTWYANPGRAEAPPVIAADKTPSKIPAAADSQAGKVIQDRVSGSGAPERVVSREEQPIALKEPAASAPPRVVLAAPVTPGQAPATTAPAAAPGEPKRIRTVTIRPDGSEARASATPASPFPPAPQNLTPAAQQQPANPPAAARPATPPRTAAPSRNSPLSLNPQGNDAAAEPLPPAPRVATAAPAPVRNSPNVGAGATGSYVVQVSSQRSEADAQASFRSLQAKFPGVLGGRQALVKRADLAEKGVFYRAMVGPFGSSDEANRFCTSLKTAGGQCIIQRN